MRLLELHTRHDPSLALSLHPRLTLVHTTPARRRELVSALVAVLSARESDLTGTVIQADNATAELLSAWSAGIAAATDLAAAIVVGTDGLLADEAHGDDNEAGDRLRAARRRAARAVERLNAAKAAHARATLPLTVASGPVRPSSPTLVDAAAADLRERAAAVGAAVIQADRDRRIALERSSAARDDVARLEAELVELRGLIAAAHEALTTAQQQAQTRQALDGQLRQLERTLVGLRAASSHALVQQDRAQRAALAAELGQCQSKKAEIEALRAQLSAEYDELPTADATALQAALAEALAARDTHEPDPVALALLDEWRSIRARLATVYDRVGRHSNLIRKARLRYETATQQFEAGRQGRPRTSAPDLAAAERHRIEAAHEAVQEAQGRATRRMAGLGARRQLDLAIENETQVLAEFGFVSYAEYLMSGSLRVLEQHASRESVELEQELQRARASLTALKSYTVPEDDMATAEAAMRDVQTRIAAYLDTELTDDIESLLTQASTITATALVNLRNVAASYGLQAGEADLVTVAENWLAERGRADERRQTITRQLATLDVDQGQVLADIDRLTAVVYEPAATPPVPAPTPEEQALEARIGDLRHRLTALDEADAAAKRRDGVSLDDLVAQEHHLTGRIADATAAYVATLSEVSATSAAVVQAEASRREVNEQLAGLTIDLSEPPAAPPAPAHVDDLAVAEATEELRRAQAEATEARQALERAQQAARLDEGDGDAVDQARVLLTARVDRLRQMGAHWPLVLDNALAPFAPDQRADLLAWLAHRDDFPQVVVLGDDPVDRAKLGPLDALAVVDLR